MLEQLPADDAHDGVEVACHGGGADRRRGQGPFKTTALGPATDARQPPHQRRHNVLAFCLEAEGFVGRNAGLEADRRPHAVLMSITVHRTWDNGDQRSSIISSVISWMVSAISFRSS